MHLCHHCHQKKTGIANYSIKLLPELIQYYDVTLVGDQSNISLPDDIANLSFKSVGWFKRNGMNFDRIIYHIGNSPYHNHMFQLMQLFSGVIVMHDFYLGNTLAYEEIYGSHRFAWSQALYNSHGYKALSERFHCKHEEQESFKERYPCNIEVLSNAHGIIFHSNYTLDMAKKVVSIFEAP